MSERFFARIKNRILQGPISNLPGATIKRASLAWTSVSQVQRFRGRANFHSHTFPIKGGRGALWRPADVAVTQRSKKKQQLISVVADTTRAVLIARSHDSDVRKQVEALLGSLGYTLSGEQVLEELKALRAGRDTILVDDASATARGSWPRARVSRLWSQLRRKR